MLRGCFSQLHIQHYQHLITSLSRHEKKEKVAHEIGEFDLVGSRDKRLPWQNVGSSDKPIEQNSEQAALDSVLSRSDLLCRSLKLRAKALLPVSPCKQLKVFSSYPTLISCAGRLSFLSN